MIFSDGCTISEQKPAKVAKNRKLAAFCFSQFPCHEAPLQKLSYHTQINGQNCGGPRLGLNGYDFPYGSKSGRVFIEPLLGEVAAS